MMPDHTAALPDTARAEILRAAEEALARLAPALPPDAVLLLHALHEGVPAAELAAEPPESLAAAAASLFAFAARRAPGTAKVRILPPGPGTGPRPVAEIVTDDMPFLVDSVLAALALHGRAVASLLHPVLRVRRDEAGALVALGGDAPGRESMMRVTLGAAGQVLSGAQPRPAGALDALADALGRTLADVRAATSAFPAMLALLRTAAQEIAAPGGPEAEDDDIRVGTVFFEGPAGRPPSARFEPAQPAQPGLELNPPGTMLDFGFAVTDGAFRLSPCDGGTRLIPLPDQGAFRVAVRLPGARGEPRVVAEPMDPKAAETPVACDYRDGMLSFRCDGAAFAYRIAAETK